MEDGATSTSTTTQRHQCRPIAKGLTKQADDPLVSCCQGLRGTLYLSSRGVALIGNRLIDRASGQLTLPSGLMTSVNDQGSTRQTQVLEVFNCNGLTMTLMNRREVCLWTASELKCGVGGLCGSDYGTRPEWNTIGLERRAFAARVEKA